MKLLVDNQLPVALARYLAENEFDCLHVQDVGMDASDDRDIWEFAESEQMVIVTKDEDFSPTVPYLPIWALTPLPWAAKA